MINREFEKKAGNLNLRFFEFEKAGNYHNFENGGNILKENGGKFDNPEIAGISLNWKGRESTKISKNGGKFTNLKQNGENLIFLKNWKRREN